MQIEKPVLVAAYITIGSLSFYSIWKSFWNERASLLREREKLEKILELKEGFVNKNDIADKFYMIDGSPAAVEIDGRPLSEIPTIAEKRYK